MAYGKTYRRSTRRTYRRPSTYTRSKAPSLPLRRRVKVARKSTVSRNTRAIKRLQLSQYGSMQVGYHKMTTHVVPIARSPVLFDMQDFSRNRVAPGGINIHSGPFYQINGGTLQSVANWENCQPTNLFWQGQQVDIIDTGKYLSCYMQYTFRVEGSGGLDDTRVRIDVFRQKSTALYAGQTTAGGSLILPTSLTHLGDMATPTENRLNSTYFKKVHTKFLYFNSRTDVATTVPPVLGTTQFTPNIKYHSFKYKPNKVVQQHTTIPSVANTPEGDVTNGAWGQFNRPANQALWCLISTDDNSALTGDSVHVTVSRKICWRDPVGSSSLSGRLGS